MDKARFKLNALQAAYRPLGQTSGAKAAVQVVLWTVLVKVALVIGGLQAAAVQYLVNG